MTDNCLVQRKEKFVGMSFESSGSGFGGIPSEFCLPGKQKRVNLCGDWLLLKKLMPFLRGRKRDDASR